MAALNYSNRYTSARLTRWYFISEQAHQIADCRLVLSAITVATFSSIRVSGRDQRVIAQEEPSPHHAGEAHARSGSLRVTQGKSSSIGKTHVSTHMRHRRTITARNSVSEMPKKEKLERNQLMETNMLHTLGASDDNARARIKVRLWRRPWSPEPAHAHPVGAAPPSQHVHQPTGQRCIRRCSATLSSSSTRSSGSGSFLRVDLRSCSTQTMAHNSRVERGPQHDHFSKADVSRCLAREGMPKLEVRSVVHLYGTCVWQQAWMIYFCVVHSVFVMAVGQQCTRHINVRSGQDPEGIDDDVL